MLLQFMKERSHSNVSFATPAFLKKVIWKHIFPLFMKEISPLIVCFATKLSREKVIWKLILHQFMKERNRSNVMQQIDRHWNWNRFWYFPLNEQKLFPVQQASQTQSRSNLLKSEGAQCLRAVQIGKIWGEF